MPQPASDKLLRQWRIHDMYEYLLADFLEVLSNERLSTAARFRAPLAVWRRPDRR